MRTGEFLLLELCSKVTRGLTGWQYDLCCNDVDPGTMSTLNDLGICSDTECEFNPGAQFCIRSPLMDCDFLDSDTNRKISTQCCYKNDGSLIDDPSLPEAGSMQMGLNSKETILEHFYQDLMPKRTCCFDEDLCTLFRGRRRTIVGDYKGSITVSAEFGGHFMSENGFEFHYLGVGVFDLLKNVPDDNENDVRVQITTSAFENSVVIRGVVVSAAGRKIEVIRPDYHLGQSLLLIDGVQSTPELFNFRVGHFIEIDLSEPSEVSVRDLRSGFVMKVLQLPLYINVYIRMPLTGNQNTELPGGILGYLDTNIFYGDSSLG